MNNDDHARAEKLILEAQVEGTPEADRAWLDAHLETCESCAGKARSTEYTLRAFRAVSVPVDSELLGSTRLRVYLRARELSDQRERRWGLIALCAMSWLVGIASAPLAWWMFKWLGKEAGLPPLVWQTALALWWMLPAGFVAAIVFWQRERAQGQNGQGTPHETYEEH